MSIETASKEDLLASLKRGEDPLEIAQRNVITSPDVFRIAEVPNPWTDPLRLRRAANAKLRQIITDRIGIMYEERFITPPHTLEFIEALIVMSDSRQILELGTYTGLGTLHMLRAILGVDGAQVTSIDSRPAHDRTFFCQFEDRALLRFIEGRTPEIFETLAGAKFDLVFIDSDHSVEHCEKELWALIPIIKREALLLFHDCPVMQDWNRPCAVHHWLLEKVKDGILRGLILPTAEQADITQAFGPDNKQFRCNLGLFALT